MSLKPQLHSEEVEVWPVALVDYSGMQGAGSIDSADLEIGLDLEAVAGADILAGAPRLPLPTCS